jgi:FkbM family methyltransferase
VDVGAKDKLEYISEISGVTTMHAFEPNMEEFQMLEKKYARHSFLALNLMQTALADKAGSGELIITQGSSMSSLLEADLTNYKKHFGEYQDYGKWTGHIGEKKRLTVQTAALDSFFQKRETTIDYLKLDTQGTELQILKGAQGLLNEKRILVIKVEVSTIPVYKDQPVFSDIDIFLRKLGYVLVDFITYRDDPRPLFRSARQKAHYGPCGDAVYILDEQFLGESQKIKCAVILSSLKYHSLALHLLKQTDMKDEEVNTITRTLGKEKNLFKNLLFNLTPPILVKLYKKLKG